MSVTKVVSIVLGSIIVLAVGLSLAMVPLGKPTLWQLIGAPAVVNSEHLIRASGEPDYTWTVHLNDVAVGLLPCRGFDSPEPLAGEIGVFCSQDEDIELENTLSETVLRIGSTSYRYDCVQDERLSPTVEPLLTCSVDPLGSLLA